MSISFKQFFGLCLILLSSFTCEKVYAQVNVSHATVTQYLQEMMDSAVVVSNPVITCADSASGMFTASSGNLGMDHGVVLTNGIASTSGMYVGVNIKNGLAAEDATNFASNNNGMPGDTDLAIIAGVNTSDACIIEFDVIPSWDTILLDYAFGSEEYTNYSCSLFNDVVGIFISGPGYAAPTNIAIIPGINNIPVTVNTINNGPTGGFDSTYCLAMGPGCPFSSYYVNNLTDTSITYDGLTQILTAKAYVTAGASYHIKIGIADGGSPGSLQYDGFYDSGLFIKGGSLRAVGINNNTAVNNVNKDNFFVYPNPFTSRFSVNVPAALLNKTVTATITDMPGRNVYSYTGVGNTLNTELAKAGQHLIAGSYILTMEVAETGFKQIVKLQKAD